MAGEVSLIQGHEKRSHFRVYYPPRVRPRVLIGDHAYQALEVSESGLRIAIDAQDAFLEQQEIDCTISFHDQTTYLVHARIVHLKPGRYAGLRLEDPLPLARIMSEQRLILQKYPTWRG